MSSALFGYNGGKAMKVLKNVLLYGTLTDVTVESGKIASIEKTDLDGEDMGGLKIYPGLIDIHSHGALGHDTMDADGSLHEMAVYFKENGITTWFPTTMTMSRDDIYAATHCETDFADGASIPGFHMEGPFINPKYKGAQNPDYIFRPDMEFFNYCNDNGKIKLVTIAPELPGSKAFIESCPAVVCLGHSDADYDTAAGAFRAGVKCLTHSFNAMPGIHHRNPGPLVAAAENESVYGQLITDGTHIHPAVVRTFIKLMGEDRVIIISDTMRATGLSDGEYDLGGQLVFVKDGVAKLESGTIAGSTTNLFGCVRTAIKKMGVDERLAVKLATENPARLMGLNKGKIEVGYDADFILVDDDFNLKKVFTYRDFEH